ncbi:glutathione S-transferase family protein [Sorangium sp. So ce128]|uniref:glutathione S-transferase family protein n=1 Tax=Sorangium sp. So ce128 TaxID=3133281 RepID=UPI003F5FEAC0
MKLYYSHNSNPRLAVAVARHVQAPVEFIRAAPFAPDQIEFFRTLNPNTRVPILIENGTPLWEADAIACRLCQLTGSEFWPAPARLPELLRWLSWAHQHFNPPASALYFEYIVKPTFTTDREEQSVMDRHVKEFRHFAEILNGLLKGRRWLIDDKLSYADFRVAFVFPYAARARLPLADYPEVQRLSNQLDELEAWREPFKDLEG